MKGKRQLTILRVMTLDEAEAAEKARIDLVSVPPALLGLEFREAAPSVFAFPALEYGDHVTADDYIRAAFQALKAEAGAFAADIEVVPGEVAAAISARNSMLRLSMGAGTGCDAQ